MPLFLKTYSRATQSHKRSLPVEQDDDIPQPLAEIPNSVSRSSRRPAGSHIPLKKARLTQTTLDVGRDTLVKCPQCGMQFHSSNPHDRKTHSLFHANLLAGIRVRKCPQGSLRVVQQYERLHNNTGAADPKPGRGDVVVEIQRGDGSLAMSLAQRALSVAEKDMGAVETSQLSLWGISHPKSTRLSKDPPLPSKDPQPSSTQHPPKRVPGQYRVYLYKHDDLVVGVCLAELIEHGRRVQAPSGPDSSSITMSEHPTAATLGISRIWVCKEYRKLQVATRLLDAATNNAIYGVTLSKDAVAFSQPTQSGIRLAKSWFKKDCGWLVYEELNQLPLKS